jgi:hypothetical protein
MTITAIAILDGEGKRVYSVYYDSTFPSYKEQREFEESLFKKTKDASGEIVMLDGITCVYRSNVDLFFYVMGSQSENEIMLFSVLSGLFDAFSMLLKRHVEKRQLFDKMDAAILIIDEIVDGGVILEVDPNVIMQRAAVKGDDGSFSDNTVVAQAIEKAKDFKWTSIFGGGR